MSKKRKMLKFTLNEISAVDRPAQGEARAVIMKRDTSKKEDLGELSLLPEEGELATLSKHADKTTDTGVDSMSDENKVADLEKRLEELEAQNLELVAKASMTDKEKAYAEKLDDEKRKEFMEKSSDDREAEMKKSEEPAPEVAKRDQEIADLQKRLDDEIAKRENDELRKRADDITKNLKGDLDVRAELLKAAEKIGDKAVEILKSADAAMSDLFKQKGSSEKQEGLTAEEELEKKAAELVKAENLNYYDAYAKAYDENPELAKRAREGE